MNPLPNWLWAPLLWSWSPFTGNQQAMLLVMNQRSLKSTTTISHISTYVASFEFLTDYDTVKNAVVNLWFWVLISLKFKARDTVPDFLLSHHLSPVTSSLPKSVTRLSRKLNCPITWALSIMTPDILCFPFLCCKLLDNWNLTDIFDGSIASIHWHLTW